MSPVYEDENTTREELFELRRKNRCQVCHGALDVFLDPETHRAYLACRDWRRTQHEGIEREAPPLFEPNILTRREDMVEELGEAKAVALEKYTGVVSLTRVQAMDILRTIWPKAPDTEVLKAGIICHQYGLNPLMRHIFLIPFKKRNRKGEVVGEEWVIVQGIGSNRLIARRRHNYSYLDLTPRWMTVKEQHKINGEVDDTKIWALTKLKDVETGAEALGVGSWPLDDRVHGAEKGNTKLNMAKIRSERQALDRLYPAEMPQGVEVMEEKYIDAEFTTISPESDEKIGGEEDKGGVGEEATATSLSSQKGEKKPKPRGAPPPAESAEGKIEGEGFSINLSWLNESLEAIKWTNETVKTFLIGKYKVSAQGTIEDIIKRLTREQAEEFVKEIENRTAQQQMDLWNQ